MYNLYLCQNYYLPIFQTHDQAQLAWQIDLEVGDSPDHSKNLSQRMNAKITHISPNEAFLVIKKHLQFWHVISGENVGWIVCSPGRATLLEQQEEEIKNV